MHVGSQFTRMTGKQAEQHRIALMRMAIYFSTRET